MQKRGLLKQQGYLHRLIFTCAILMLMGSCTSPRRIIGNAFEPTLGTEIFSNQFTGFLVIDPQTNDTLYEGNSDKYFTPASNTKIFTLYAALKNIPENIPALKYITQNDTVYIEGTGDPSFLHPHFGGNTALQFLKGQKNIALYLNNFKEEKYGPGWAWDDYQYYYQPERSGFPMYGNVSTLFKADSLHVIPSYFEKNTIELSYTKNRDEDKNQFYYSPSARDTLEIPFRVDSTLIRDLLETALKKKLRITNRIPDGKKSILYGISSDSIYTRMMHVSDNFLAEQLMLLVSSTLSDTLNFDKARDYVFQKQLTDLKQEPLWVDGSGLSRYNLFTPQSFVQVLQKLYTEVPEERLFQFFPAGGVSGTLEDWYGGDPKPYIYAKSGSLGNNYCLSGYLLTKSGRILIFSFMNNHFIRPTSAIKEKMQSIFEMIREKY